MKTPSKRKMMASSALRWSALSALGICVAAYALTPANTVITNKALVEYFDESGNFFDSESNPAEVTVGEVFAATIANDRLDFTGAPGQQVYIPYTLVNNGNAADTYTLGVATSTALAGASGPLSATYAGADLSASVVAIYPDNDGDGEPDVGSSPITSLNVDAETIQQLVVAVNVPVTGAADDEIGVVLTATSANTTVNDLTTLNGVDALDETVAGRVTITTDAVLVLTKDSTVVGNTIEYVLTVKNNGNTAATGLEIYDLMPYADIDGSGTLTTGDIKLTYTAASVGDNGLGNAGDTVAASYTTFPFNFDESLGGDLNDDGDQVDDFLALTAPEVTGIYALDASIAQNVEISVTYTATVPSGIPFGTDILNTFCVTADLDGAGAGGFTSQCSNETIDDTPQIYDVNVGDTSATTATDQTAPDGVESSTYAANDEDDDNNDVQRIDEASEGETITFFHVVENTGNGPDSFTIDVATNELFPSGTTFVYKDATGSVLSGGNTTPIIASGGTVVIQVMAMLPGTIVDGGLLGDGTFLEEDQNGLFCVDADTAGANDCTDPAATPFTTTLTATSVGGGNTDTTGLELGAIVPALVDLADVVTNNVAGTSFADGTYTATDLIAPGDFQPDAGAVDGTEAPYNVNTANIPGDSVVFELMVGNETGGSDTFIFDLDYLGYQDTVPNAYDLDDDASGVDGIAAGDLPSGWSVQYFDSAGDPITSSTLLPSDGTAASVFFYTAVVTIPSTASLAPVGEYDIRFTATSNATGAVDSIVNSIVVEEDCSIELTTGQTDSIQAGGTVDFGHILRNSGNTTEDLEIGAVFSSGSPSGWSQIVQVETSDGVYADYVAGATVLVRLTASATTTTETVVDQTPELTVTLAPDEYVNIRIRVFTPATASDGTTEDVVLSVTPFGTSSCSLVTNTDTVQVIDRQVRITKSVAIDTDCNCVADDADFAETGTTDVNPGECVIWKLEAENQGTEPALNVVIRDAITDFTVLASAVSVNSSTASANELQSCVSSFLVSGCVSDLDTAETDDEGTSHNLVNGSLAVNVDGSLIAFPIGQVTGDAGADPSVTDADRTDGGTLVSGDSGVAMFCAVVE